MLVDPFALPLAVSQQNCLVGADPHLYALCQPLFQTGMTVLVLLLSLVGVLVQLLPFHFLELLLCNVHFFLSWDLPLKCLINKP